MSGRVTLKLKSRPTGLAAVCETGPRGWDIRVDGRRVGAVAPIQTGRSGGVGWYYYVSDAEHGIPHRNTCNEPQLGQDVVRAEAVAYVRTAMANAVLKLAIRPTHDDVDPSPQAGKEGE